MKRCHNNEGEVFSNDLNYLKEFTQMFVDDSEIIQVEIVKGEEEDVSDYEGENTVEFVLGLQSSWSHWSEEILSWQHYQQHCLQCSPTQNDLCALLNVLLVQSEILQHRYDYGWSWPQLVDFFRSSTSHLHKLEDRSFVVLADHPRYADQERCGDHQE